MTTPPARPTADVSTRLFRMTVAELREQLADAPDWAEVRLNLPLGDVDAYVDTAVADADYGRGFFTLTPDESNPRIPEPPGANDDQAEKNEREARQG